MVMSFGLLPRILRTASFGLSLLYAALLAASVIIIGGVVYWSIEASLERQMTARIDAEISLLQDELKSEGNSELIEEVQRRTDNGALEYLLVDAEGKRIAGGLPVNPTSSGWSDVRLPAQRSGAAINRAFHIHSVLLSNGMHLSVADDYDSIEDVRKAWLEASLWSLIAFLFLSLIGGLVLSQQFLKRVDVIRKTAEAIIQGDLRSRIPIRGTNDNFDLLSDTLNRMLDRIQILMEGARHMANDIAHALRTPLGRLQQRVEVARRAAAGNFACETAIQRVQLETEIIQKTFSALLRISKIEVVARQAGFRDIELSGLFESVCDAYSVAAEEQGTTIVTKISPLLWTRGDEELLAEMLANLLDNAIRHTPVGTHIEVSLYRVRSKIVATIADDGLGVPEDEREKILQRFYRLKRSAEIEGSGLGLALVAAVAALHGLQLTVENNAPGLRVVLTFNAIRREEAARAAATEWSPGRFGYLSKIGSLGFRS
jgi:signal transduction histidine kinase